MQSAECQSRETLKKYLMGWADPNEASEIEAHLMECDSCEQTISGLESDPDTLVALLHPRTVEDASKETRDAVEDPVVDYALNRSKALVESDHTSASHDLPPAPLQSIGPYEFIQTLGRGSMGTVYLALHEPLRKRVAIKLLSTRPFRNDEFTSRFQREIRAAGALDHPSIISATDAGQVGSIHYLVMEYIDGMDLSRLTRLTGPLSIADACSMMASVALGLSHAHMAGIVHRDIKPSNLMLSRSGQVKILDFGLAQTSMWDEAAAELTTVGQLMGTIDYMAPEQAERAESVDYRADLYSLGATLFKLLCGRAPLAATPDLSPLAKLRLLATTQPPSLSTLRADAPNGLVQLVNQLLSRDPSQRPASAAHVAEQLAEFSRNANLSALMLLADERASKEPSPSDTIPLLAPNSPNVQPKTTPSADVSRGGGSRFSSKLLATAAMAFFALAGIIVAIETQKGQLIIESMDKDVEITIKKSGKHYDTIRLVPGATATRLYAGSYEVSIGGGSDNYQLDRETIEIKRGETVIARVGSKPKPVDEPITLANKQDLEWFDAGNTGSATVFAGKTLEVWLNDFARERSPEEIEKALEAIAALAQESNKDYISKRLLSSLRDLPSKHDTNAFQCLYVILDDPNKFSSHLLATLDAQSNEWLKNDAWAKRVLQSAIPLQIRLRTQVVEDKRSLATELRPYTEWIVEKLLSHETESNLPSELTSPSTPIIESGADLLAMIVNIAAFDPETEDRYLQRMKSHQALSPSFWSRFVPHQDANLNFLWNPKLVSLIESKAIEAFCNEETPERYVAESAMLLSMLFDNSKRTRLSEQPSVLNRISEVLSRRLNEALDHPNALFSPLSVSPAYSRLIVPNATSDSKLRDYSIQFSVTQDNRCILLFELLDLVEKLMASGHSMDGRMKPLARLESMLQTNACETLSKSLLDPFALPRSDSLRGGGGGMRPNRHVMITWPNKTINVTNMSLMSGSNPFEFSGDHFLGLVLWEKVLALIPDPDRSKIRKECLAKVQKSWLQSLIRLFDSDQDGFLVEAEWATPVFSTVDTDADQKISTDELFEYCLINGLPRTTTPRVR